MRQVRDYVVIILLLGTVLFGQASAQWVIRVKTPVSTPKHADVYIAGDFNMWDPGDPEYRLQKVHSGLYSITISDPGEVAEFKFTLGSWDKVEVLANGDDRDNREEIFVKDITQRTYRVLKWKDLDRGGGISGDVRIIEGFYMPQLDRTRRLWIYLPPGYEKSDERYPVLYMHDGQNLFSDTSSFSGEWGVDETLEKMISHKQIEKMIVVGIDNDPEHRLNEYSPNLFEYEAIKFYPQAKDYAAFIVETLKPYIDSTFRTKPEREFTAVAGSSMGGLVSVYIGVKYQDVFSKVGALSSSFGVCKDYMIDFISRNPKRYPMRFWLDMGSEELGHMDMDDYQLPVTQALIDAGWIKGKEVMFREFKGAQHNEAFWRNRFHKVLKFLFR